MAYSLQFVPALALAFFVSPFSLTSQSTAVPTPRTLTDKAIALSNSDKILTRYTYFKLKKTQNRHPKGKLFVNDATLYEYTWITDGL